MYGGGGLDLPSSRHKTKTEASLETIVEQIFDVTVLGLPYLPRFCLDYAQYFLSTLPLYHPALLVKNYFNWVRDTNTVAATGD